MSHLHCVDSIYQFSTSKEGNDTCFILPHTSKNRVILVIKNSFMINTFFLQNFVVLMYNGFHFLDGCSWERFTVSGHDQHSDERSQAEISLEDSTVPTPPTHLSPLISFKNDCKLGRWDSYLRNLKLSNYVMTNAGKMMLNDAAKVWLFTFTFHPSCFKNWCNRFHPWIVPLKKLT